MRQCYQTFCNISFCGVCSPHDQNVGEQLGGCFVQFRISHYALVVFLTNFVRKNIDEYFTFEKMYLCIDSCYARRTPQMLLQLWV